MITRNSSSYICRLEPPNPHHRGCSRSCEGVSRACESPNGSSSSSSSCEREIEIAAGRGGWGGGFECGFDIGGGRGGAAWAGEGEMLNSDRSGGCEEVGDWAAALAMASLPLIVATGKSQLEPAQKGREYVLRYR